MSDRGGGHALGSVGLRRDTLVRPGVTVDAKIGPEEGQAPLAHPHWSDGFSRSMSGMSCGPA